MSKNGAAPKHPNFADASLGASDLAKRIRSFPVFRGCSDEFINTFANIAQKKAVPAGTAILNEGQANSYLMILSAGRVEVLVEGERVAVLESPGDLLGEISVLTSRPASATVVAETPVEYLAIDIKDLHHNISQSKSDFGFHLYSALSFVVSEKIVRTNEKARRFEMANRALTNAMSSLEEANRTLDQKVKERTRDLSKKTEELQTTNLDLESRNSELLASHRKLEELYSSKEMTFKKLNQLQSHYLTPLIDTLGEVEADATPSERARIERAKAQVQGSIEMLRPMSELYSTEQAIRSRRVLLVESDKKQQVISKLALGGTGVRLDIAANEQEGLAHLSSGTRYDLVFVGSDMGRLIPEARRLVPAAKLVFMASCNVPGELPVLKGNAGQISNIVSRHPEDRTFTVKNVATTVSKLVSKDIFGLEKYMIWGVEVQSRPVTKSEDRSRLIEEMQDNFKQLGVRSTISDRAATVAEEILMNCIYDAPMASDGRPLYNHLPRTQSVTLQKSEYGEFRYGCDGMLAGISVSDPFGGFKMDTLINYLERNYGGGVDVQETGKGGAGRGLHMIIEHSDLVVFNVQKNVRTEVIALFNLDARAVVEGAKPSFHFFSE